MQYQLSAEAHTEWRAHWKLVLAATTGASMMSIALSALGAYMLPLEHDFGWKRAEVSAGFSIFAVAGVVLSPILGGLIDRWGARRFALPGVLLYGLAFALLGTATGSLTYWLALWVVFAVCAQIPRPLIWMAAVSSEFDKSRGLALGLVMAGAGFGGLAAPVLAGHLIDLVGWRFSFAILGLGWGGIAWVMCFLFFHSRTDRRDGSATAKNTTDLPGVSAREGFKSLTFAKLALTTLLVNTLCLAVTVHSIPLLIGGGLQPTDATWISGLIGIAAIVGQLSAGSLADRYPGHYLSDGYICLFLVPCGLLITPSDSVLLRMIPIIALGIATGGHSYLLSYLTTRYFGLRAFGKIFGVIASISALTVGLGPVLAGYVYDQTHSYRLLLLAGIPAVLFSALLILSLGRYPESLSKLQ